jgi:MFS family permease
MLLVTDGVRAVLIAGLLGSTGIVGGFHPSLQVQLASIYAVVFVTTAAAQFFGPARYALIRDVVPEAEQPRATSLSQVNASVSSIIGPPLAVPLLFVLGIQWALIADALSFALSFSLIALVKAPPAAPIQARRRASSASLARVCASPPPTTWLEPCWFRSSSSCWAPARSTPSTSSL